VTARDKVTARLFCGAYLVREGWDMPTYVCSVPNGKLNDTQMQDVAAAITKRHSDATGAPPFFVQVVIEEQGMSQRLIGGMRSDEHIWIRVDLRSGRSAQQLEQIMSGVMEDVSRITGVPSEHVWIYLCQFAPTDMLEYGRVLPTSGEEQASFDALPLSLRRYLESVGTRSNAFSFEGAKAGDTGMAIFSGCQKRPAHERSRAF
jgi:phenylpyruvate tautomerase PptA (4-oxalocrotonate tautomerase family)